MAANREDNIDSLNKLVEILKDGNDGYKSASENVSDQEIKTILYRLSQQRALFEAELKNEIRVLGGDPERTGESFQGTMSKIWNEWKAGISTKRNKEVIDQCRKNELDVVKAYEEALKADLPEYLKDKLVEQHKLVRGAIMQLQEFGNEFKD
jgi:uncharacterized protein (TIGR02284 family)